MTYSNIKSSITLEDVENMSEEEMSSLTIDDYYELDRLAKERDHIKHKALPETSAQDLRTQILSHGVTAIERVQQVLVEGNRLEPAETQAYDMLWPIIENLIAKTEDLKVIEANNAKEVLQAVSKGKMTITEGLGMMALLKDQVTIEELPKLLERLGELEGE